ncbi:hypothetical protein PIB30_049967 [Stylosanthes scabra]|uniref:Replication protein A 70 kDa DNA-binding subunit B/D first OB fold domain-containing protein n=1 Tax=Stylosanthes scabra TaxID=79078 RepID=A0ABU6YEX7_9FABA|nr:hypothetical protein [Stylosanthes scabra]
MDSSFDSIRDICNSSSGKIWNFRVRLIRHWKVPSVLDRKYKSSIELVFINTEGTRISPMIRPFHVRQFDAILNDGNVYLVSNVAVAANDVKFKTASYKCRLIFKKDSKIEPSLDDLSIPKEAYDFWPTSKILSTTRDDAYLIGTMTISNTNYTTSMLINPDIPAVVSFKERVNANFLNNQVEISPIAGYASYDISNDLLHITNYATISHIKETKEKTYFSTVGIVRDIAFIFELLMPSEASFVIFETACAQILGILASDLVNKLVMQGAIATSINSQITVAGPTAEISKGEGSLSKTLSPPPLKKSRSSKSQTVDIEMPLVMLIDQNGTTNVNSSDIKPSAKKNLLTEFNMTARKGGKKPVDLIWKRTSDFSLQYYEKSSKPCQ